MSSNGHRETRGATIDILVPCVDFCDWTAIMEGKKYIETAIVVGNEYIETAIMGGNKYIETLIMGGNKYI